MDDLRVLWMRDRVYTAFGLTDPQLFEDLMTRDDGEAEDLILHFLNQASDEEAAATLFFYRRVVPEEVEVEIGEPAAPLMPLPPLRAADLCGQTSASSAGCRQLGSPAPTPTVHLERQPGMNSHSKRLFSA